MEARLIYVHKDYIANSGAREWCIINPLKFGIRIDESQIPAEYTSPFNANIHPDVSHFLTEIAGQGGLWDGWTLYAVGNMRYTSEAKDATPNFQTVFVREARTAEGSGGEEFEIVGGKEELEDEDFAVVQRGGAHAAHGK